MREDVVETVIHKAVIAASLGNASAFARAIGDLENRGWESSGVSIIESLLRATEELPSADPSTAAEITKRVADRFAESLSIIRPMMEAVIRGAMGEREASRGIPRDVSAVYALLVIGQIVHEGYLTVDEALGHAPPNETRADVPDHGN